MSTLDSAQVGIILDAISSVTNGRVLVLLSETVLFGEQSFIPRRNSYLAPTGIHASLFFTSAWILMCGPSLNL